MSGNNCQANLCTFVANLGWSLTYFYIGFIFPISNTEHRGSSLPLRLALQVVVLEGRRFTQFHSIQS